MKRTWFKKEMRQAILDGKKVSTTRDHRDVEVGDDVTTKLLEF